MLAISGTSFDVSTIKKEYTEGGIERLILDQMAASGNAYRYDNLNQLKFELGFRREIVNAALNLNGSELAFAVFQDSRCNPEYWSRTDNGGFLKKEGVRSDEAIHDIFVNGDQYATECATAMMIVYYRGLLNVFGATRFNKLFPKIYLMDWDVREPLLEEVNNLKAAADILPGDRGYFNNPDFDPETPEWEGENVIVLPGSLYYGHGIGIAAADAMIRSLNSKRKEGATRSAYFDASVGRPDFKALSDVYDHHLSRPAPLVWRPFPAPISAR